MKHRSTLFSILAILLVSFFAFSSSILLADDSVEVEGVIEAIGNDSLVVQGVTFYVNSNTEIRNEQHMRLQFSDLAVGDYVEVEGYRSGNGKIMARRIELRSQMDDHDNEMEISGRIQEKDSVSLVVQGVRFYVDSYTKIMGEHQMLQFDDLQVGQFVEVKAYQSGDRWIARKIKVENDFSQIEVEGVIEAIGGDSLIVRGFVFHVDSNTVIRGDHDASLSFDDLAVGDYVEVKAFQDDSGRYVAIRIKREDDNGHQERDQEMELEGRITHLTDSSMVVNNIYIRITPQTRFEGPNDMPFSKDSLKIGLMVEVKVQLNNQGVWVAIKIKAEHPERMENYVEIEGQVEEIGANYFVVNGVTFYVNANTLFFGRGHQALSFTDLAVNDWVEVKAQKQSDGSFLALRVKIEKDRDGRYQVEAEGLIDTVYADIIVVNGMEFYVDSATVITDKSGNSYSLADLKAGMRVEVKAYVDDNGNYIAVRIKIEDLWNAHFEVKAPIDSISGNTLYILGEAIIITDTTVIRDENGNLVGLDYLTAGMWVKIHGTILEDGTLIALKIKVKNNQRVELEFTAAIDSVASDGLYINGYFFLVNDQTEIYGLRREPLTLADLQAGMIVEIKAIQQADGSFLAVRIRVEDKPGVARMNGIMDGKTDRYIMVGNQMVLVTDNTVFLDSNYNPIQFADLPVGTSVTIITDENTATGSTEALQVQETAPGEVTGIRDGNISTVPQEFLLGQNYPNPFNPSTTIPVKIAGTEWHKVQLIIYNALGQRVAVLFDGVLQGGNYQFTWNGRNQFNRPVPSGIYFYQLLVDKQAVATRKMILMK